MIKLSFIVPFYNVEKYIGACLDSLYAQDIPEEEYEVVCVDDCSPDNSKSIVRVYQKQHANLVLIEHTENKCLGGARNTGISVARGKYLWFVDSDDFIEKNKLPLLLAECLKFNLDVLCFNYQRVNKSGNTIENAPVFSDSDVQSGIDFINNMFGSSFVYHLGYVWRCIYRTDYLKENGLYFPEHVIWEDTVFFPKSILMGNKVKSVPEIVYCYRVNSDSISGMKNKFLADRTFQFAFVAGLDLFHFSKEFELYDKNIAQNLENKSYWYFNSFTKPLSLSLLREKHKFYALVKNNKALLNQITPFLNSRNKLLLKPFFGIYFSSLIKPLYLLKLKLKKI